MFAWINVYILVLSFFLTSYCYLRSAAPFAYTKLRGKPSYEYARNWRIIASLFMFISMANYVLYYFFPLPGLPLPQTFPWPYWITLLITAAFTIPAMVLMGLGLKAAGKEALSPQEDTTLYGGIYKKLRHPQAYEAFLYLAMGTLLNSPFLTIISLLGFPVIIMMVEAEERDLAFRLGEDYCKYWRTTGAYWPRRKKD